MKASLSALEEEEIKVKVEHVCYLYHLFSSYPNVVKAGIARLKIHTVW